MTARIGLSDREVSNRWPNIRRFLRIEPSGWVEDDFLGFGHIERTWSRAERAAANEEWADFFEWRLEQRAAELANDPSLRGIVERWTDDMAYCCRRCAAWARGVDPGEWVPQWERRPDLDAALRARVAEITAELACAGGHDRVPQPAVRRVRRGAA